MFLVSSSLSKSYPSGITFNLKGTCNKKKIIEIGWRDVEFVNLSGTFYLIFIWLSPLTGMNSIEMGAHGKHQLSNTKSIIEIGSLS